jgi:hypothetical protein
LRLCRATNIGWQNRSKTGAGGIALISVLRTPANHRKKGNAEASTVQGRPLMVRSCDRNNDRTGWMKSRTPFATSAGNPTKTNHHVLPVRKAMKTRNSIDGENAKANSAKTRNVVRIFENIGTAPMRKEVCFERSHANGFIGPAPAQEHRFSGGVAQKSQRESITWLCRRSSVLPATGAISQAVISQRVPVIDEKLTFSLHSFFG